MSSKSRQKSQANKKMRGHARDPKAGETAHDEAPRAESGVAGIPDEIVHVPKNTSAIRFLLMIALVIVLLIIFVVPQAITSTVGSHEEAVYARWEQPGEGTVELTRTQLVQERRLLNIALPLMGFSAIQLGFTGRDLSEEATLRFLFLDRLAATSGLHVSDADLAEFLAGELQRLGGTENYMAYVRRNGGAPAIEGMIRRCLRAMRYTQVAGMIANVPDPAEIERLWGAEHVEQTYDFVALPLADVDDAARAELPPDEDLRAWFDALPAEEKAMMQLPERRRAQFALYRFADGVAPAALLERYPEPVDAVAEERAKEYYDRVFFRRFLRPEDETPAEDAGAEPPTPYLSFEEVRDACLAEAPVYFAMTEWLKELRNAESTVDLKAESEALGLTYAIQDEPVGLLELRERSESELGGTNLTNSVFQTKEGELALTVIAGEEQLAVVHVVERLEPMLPPFEDIRDDVADRWVDDAVRDLALDRLRALRDAFTTDLPEGVEPEEDPALAGTRRFADAATFAAEAAKAGLEVQQRGWLDKSDFAASDPALDEATNAFFLRAARQATLAVGEVGEPSVDGNSETAYLVRLADERQVAIDAMTAEQYEGYKRRSAGELSQSILFQPTYEELVQDHGLWVDGADRSEDAEEDDTPDANGEG